MSETPERTPASLLTDMPQYAPRLKPVQLPRVHYWSALSHLYWANLPTWERNSGITGKIASVFAAIVERFPQDSMAHYDGVADRCAAVGLPCHLGIQFGPNSADDLAAWLNPAEHEACVWWLNNTNADRVLIDVEPYYTAGARYHGDIDVPALMLATKAWASLRVPELWLAPSGPAHNAAQAVASWARTSGARVYCVDESAYNARTRIDDGTYDAIIRGTRAWCELRGWRYVPGIYLANLQFDDVLPFLGERGITDVVAWGAPASKDVTRDDKYKFGSPDWAPDRYANRIIPADPTMNNGRLDDAE